MGTARPTAEMQTPEQHRERLHEIVKSARTVMLLSHGADHEISGRPMALIRTDDDTTMYLVSPIDSQEILEIDRECRVSISIQVNDAFAMFDGEARISQDRGLIDELWNDTWSAWFDGKDDPAIAIHEHQVGGEPRLNRTALA